SAGTHNVTAAYPGDSTFAASSGATSETIQSQASLVSLSPSSGQGASGNFTMTYSDAAGWADLRSVWVNFGTTTSGAGSCWVGYYPNNNLLYLRSDDGSAWLPPVAPGSTPLSNSQCTVTSSSANNSGSNVVLSLSVNFTFVGQKNVYMYATTMAGLTTG